MRAIRPEQSETERGRTSLHQFAGSVYMTEMKTQFDAGDPILEDAPRVFWR